MLNAVLTVRAHQANSHKDRGWEQFTDAVIAWLNKHTAGTVFMLWGSYAQKKGACIDKASASCSQYLPVTTFFMKSLSVTAMSDMEDFSELFVGAFELTC